MTIQDSAAELLRDARRVVVFTGAGVSAESGVPTFRSAANALWREVDVRNFAYPDGYRRNQPEAWRWYAERAAKAIEVVPNAGHYAIAEIEQHVDAFLLVTQNIDSLHQRAGSKNVLELHGNLRAPRCFDCGARSSWIADPICEQCGGLLRPDVVMFEEDLPEGAMERAGAAAEACDVLISVGTSNLVWPATEVPRYAIRGGAQVIIVNPDMEGQPIGRRITYLVGASGEILPEVVSLAWP
ncbi:MAG: NAD-dependent protein deacylase [Gemmatimonadetes bacterium]|nr:MAG: NAD-dependent protein deacylase [Gemmatimonadota bacterium]